VRTASHIDKAWSGLPQTLPNLRTVHDLKSEAQELRRRNEMGWNPGTSFQKSLDVARQFHSIPPGGAIRFAQALKALNDVVMDSIGIDGMGRVNGRLDYFREIGEFLQSAFARPQDLDSAPRRYSSRSGYSFTLPRGWILWSDELVPLLKASSPPPSGADVFAVRTGFFGERGEAVDKIFFLVLPGTEVLTDALLRQIETDFLTSGAQRLPDFRQHSVQPTSIGNYPAVLLQALTGPETDPARSYDVIVPASTQTVAFYCRVFDRRPITDCSSVANSLHID
jgi:hypothetical protein